jgi:hypothetical protein
MERFLEIIISWINTIGFLPLFLVGLLLSLFLFWKESHAHKNRNSLFDMWFLSILVAMFWGRLAFIISNWELFESLPWAIAPYERYGESIFFFRLLPWKFFDLRDGGFLFTGIFAAYVLFAFLYNIFVKKWKWREMFFPVIISAEVLLAFILIVYGALAGFGDVVIGGLVIAAIIALFLAIITILRWRLRKSYHIEVINGIIHFLVILFIIVSFTIITRLFFSYEISLVDKINVVVMNVTGLIVTLYFVLIERRRVKDGQGIIPGGKSVVININKPVKIGDGKA